MSLVQNEKIIESPLYYEPFVAYVPKHHHLSGNKYLEVDDLSNTDRGAGGFGSTGN